MFSLEQLAKIKNAKEDAAILDFFNVLDKAVGQEDMKLEKRTVDFSELRSDEVELFKNIELIRKNFPQRVGDYLKVPKVV